MSRNSNIGLACVFAVAVGVGSYMGYRLATDQELRNDLADKFHAVLNASKGKVEMVSEEVALKKAMVTNNPKINQEWVDRQWEMAIS